METQAPGWEWRQEDDPRGVEKKKKATAITFATKKLLEEVLMALKSVADGNIHSKDYRSTISQTYHQDVRTQVRELIDLEVYTYVWLIPP